MDNQESMIFTETTVVYAGFWERFAAAFLDGLILLVPNLLVTYLLVGSMLNTSGSFLPTIINILIGWAYAAALESGPHQATLGKRAMKIKVTDTNGRRISFAQASGRHFGKILSGLILCIGYLMMLWSDKKQTLHDKMANTLVVAA